MSENCSQEKTQKIDFSAQPHKLSSIKKVIGVVSGKGGVGKSLVTSLLAIAMQRKGYNTAILDADVTGPSIPKTFGLKEKAGANELGMLPVKSKTGIDIMSINLLLENDTDPVIWRGPIIARAVKQFWTDVIWSDIDYMFIDMPPGTGDVPLTVFQSIPVDGIVIVTSPQELVSMIVAKAVKMAETMNIPIIGLVENMSYFECPGCDRKYNIFGDSHVTEIAQKHNIDMIARLPINPKIAESCDKGDLESFEIKWLDTMAAVLERVNAKPKSKNRRFECEDCGDIWEVEPCTAGGVHGYEIPCPKCGSMKKIKIGDDGQRHTCGGHHEHGHEGGCCCH